MTKAQRREIVGTYAKMFNYRQLASHYEEMERHASQDAQELVASLGTEEDQEAVEQLKKEAQENYLALSEAQERREERRRRRERS
jgi:uncharacterized membrane-anchored protein YhcB (DUF1043 family)